ncbi:Os08g0485000 [Oryza sativa Japonica Group]|uniref:Os08g0485000 protein n=1 Tax=Oryza sativa subsp. japonica TaxID=39947 RepID=A0A0P0XHB9_ORYSJ|nr:hypothetical protein EE612_044986 [Oryza sativa]BAT05966.1 Os08g0485000 [Oryza sativa Japonica Group]
MAHKRGRLVGWVLLLLLAVAIAGAAAATPRQLFLVTQAPVTLTNHHGQLLTGNYSVNLLWYGRFTPAQRATVADFLLSMPPPPPRQPRRAGAAGSRTRGWGTRRSSARGSARGRSTSRRTALRRRRWCRRTPTWGWTASSSTSPRCSPGR